ncbi:MAG: hypothetical protein JWM10_3010 [Myxococcaceae bacterium]|nr:hypothetical protein [Myxococcaceae bacterium]
MIGDGPAVPMDMPGLPIPVTTPGGDASLALLQRIAEALEKTGKSADDAGKKAQASSTSWASLGESLGRFATHSNQILQFGQTIIAATEHVADLAAEQQRLDLQSARLGLNFDEAAAGAGRFTDEVDAMNAAGQLAARGIRVTQTELNAMTHAAARMAQQTGIETTAALDQLTTSLVRGRERGLAPFGEQLAATARHGYSVGEGLAAIVAQEEHMATATDDAHTSMLGFNDALGDAARGFATMTTNGLGLDGVVAALTRKLGELAGALRAINDPLQTAGGREENDNRNAAIAEYTAARGAMRAQLERGGGDVSLLPGIDVANQSPAQLRNQAARLREISGRAGGDDGRGGGILIGGVDPLAAPVDLDTAGAERELRTLRDTVVAERAQLAAANAPTDASARNHAVSADSGASAARARELAEERRQGRLLLAAFRDYAAERRSAEHALAEDLERSADVRRANERFSEARQLAEAARNPVKVGVRANAFDFARQTEGADNAADFDTQAGDKMLSITRSGATGQLGDGIDDHATQINTKLRAANDDRLADERSFTGQLRALYGQQANAAQGAAELSSKAIEGFGNSFAKHALAVASGAETVGEALQGMLADTLSSIAQEAAVKGAFEMAAGVGALAGVYTAGLAPGHFAAGAAYLGVAALAGAGAVALAPSAPSRASAGASGSGSQRAAPVSARDRQGGDGGVVINVSFGGPVIGAGGARQVGRYLADQLNAASRQGGVTLSPSLMRVA